MIHPRKLDAVLHVLGPRLSLNLAPLASDDAYTNSRSPAPNRTADGVAIVQVFGTLTKRSLGMNAESGLTSYSEIQEQVTAAMKDPRVRSLLFDIDSPGGEAAGLFDFCNFLISQRDRKPMTAFCNDSAYSAAYAVASCADRVVVTQVGGVGGIGVYSLHLDQSKADEKAGLKYSYVYSGDKKTQGNPHQPLSSEAIATLQEECDRVRQMFVSLVAKNRGVDPKKIFDTEAATYMGESGVPMLADAVATYDEALAFAGMSDGHRATAMSKARLRRLSAAAPEPAPGSLAALKARLDALRNN
jgi:ClpP class serine protease